MFRLTDTSLIFGRFSMTQTSAARMVAGRMPTAAFFAPDISTSPIRGLPPVITNFSKVMISFMGSAKKEYVPRCRLDGARRKFHYGRPVFAAAQMRRRLLQLPYYTQLAKKSKVSGPAFALIFCFAQILQIHSLIFSLLHRMFMIRPGAAGLYQT